MLNDALHPMIFPLAFLTSPGFLLAGVGLAAIPIIIHILNRRRFKVVYWAAMEYLLQAMRKNRRRVKFEQILLLATRCAVLALLGLALARPLGCGDNPLAASVSGRSALHVFVIDNSYSMGFEYDRGPGARTHLDQAKLLVKQQIEKLVPGSESVAIVTAARPKAGPGGTSRESQVALRPGFDLEQAKLAVDRIELTATGTDVAGALAAAIQISREETRQQAKFLYILSDSTRSAWEDPNRAEYLRQLGREIADPKVFGRGRVRYNDLSKPGQWNYAVLDLRADGTMVTTAFHTDFLADVKGYGAGGDAFVQWKWDERPLPEAPRLRPDAGSQPVRNGKVRTDQGGPHVLSVSLASESGSAADRLKVDNARWRVFEVASELKVLIVEGKRSEGRLSGSGAFLDTALAPAKEVGSDGRVRSDSYVAPELITADEFGNRALGAYRAVILTDVGNPSSAQAEQLAQFVEAGGTLMIFMGEEVDAGTYNATMLPRRLLPGKLVTRKTAADQSKPYTLNFTPDPVPHPILNVFRGEKNSGLDTARIFTYVQMELSPEAKAETVLKYLDNGKATEDPAITLHAAGRGRVVVVTTTANGDWNSLPPKPAYIPLVHELLAGTVDVGDKWMNLTTGQALEVPAALKVTRKEGVQLLDPAKRPVPIEPVTDPAGAVGYRSGPLDKPGLYALDVGGAAALPIAVNVPADEADVRPIPPEAIRKALGDALDPGQMFGDTTPASALARDDSSDLGWFVMLAVLVLVGAECFMAMAFGHYRRSSVERGPVQGGSAGSGGSAGTRAASRPAPAPEPAGAGAAAG